MRIALPPRLSWAGLRDQWLCEAHVDSDSLEKESPDNLFLELIATVLFVVMVKHVVNPFLNLLLPHESVVKLILGY